LPTYLALMGPGQTWPIAGSDREQAAIAQVRDAGANCATGATIDLPAGPFTVGTGPGPAIKGVERTDEAVHCAGDAAPCRAAVDLVGADQTSRVTVDMPHSGLGLGSVRPGPVSEKIGFHLSNGSLADYGERYVVDVGTPQTEPTGARLVLTFG
jgi:hypothetical protein